MNAVLVVGSNYGDRRANVRLALDFIADVCAVNMVSDIYESEDFKGSECVYLNAVAKVESALGIEELTTLFKELETKLGRDEEKRERGEVPIDIDIVVWEEEIIRPRDFTASYFKKGFSRLKPHPVKLLLDES